ncbi:hypothetical protein MD484_g2433, partial [Candolleomyces efflorescens]
MWTAARLTQQADFSPVPVIVKINDGIVTVAVVHMLRTSTRLLCFSPGWLNALAMKPPCSLVIVEGEPIPTILFVAVQGLSRYRYNFQFNRERRPFFPDINEDEILLSDLRKIVFEFLNLQWESGHVSNIQAADVNDDKDTIPVWMSGPLAPGMRDCGLSLSNPLSAGTLELLALFQQLKTLQSTVSDALQVFDKLPAASSTATTINKVSLAIEESVDNRPLDEIIEENIEQPLYDNVHQPLENHVDPPHVDKPLEDHVDPLHVDKPLEDRVDPHHADKPLKDHIDKPLDKDVIKPFEENAKKDLEASEGHGGGESGESGVPQEHQGQANDTQPENGKGKRKVGAADGDGRRKKRKDDSSIRDPYPSTSLRRSGRSKIQPKGTRPSIANDLPVGKNWYWAPVRHFILPALFTD